MAQVIAANFEKGFIVIDDGRLLPIIGFFDEDNMPTTDFRDAVSFVAGYDTDWYQGIVSAWAKMTIH
jgi:hypothetical protein